MKSSICRLIRGAFALVCGALLALPALAADPTGTWKWSFETQDGSVRESTMKLKLADGKLTGSVTGRQGAEAEISDAKLDGDKISFKVVRERDGNKFTINYHGTLSGDAIKGKMEGSFGGNDFSRDWEPKRDGVAKKEEAKPAAAASASGGVAGSWKWSVQFGDNTLNSTLKLTQDGEKVTGTITTNERESKVEEGTFKGGEIAFQTTRERDGNKFVVKYKGKLEGDSIKGQASMNFGGEDRTFDWNPTRAK